MEVSFQHDCIKRASSELQSVTVKEINSVGTVDN